MGRKTAAFAALLAFAFLISAVPAFGWTAKAVKDDPLVFMPGSQPGTVQNFENASRCENCHSNYNAAVEPGSNWRGSMMAQAARDPLWLACLTVSAQDSIWAVGNPNATDICIRCHSPQGWLEGASDPTNTSLLTGNQLDGVACDFCHRKIDSMAANKQPDVPAEIAGSTAAQMAASTYSLNTLDLSALKLFDGTPFFNTTTSLPVWYGVFPAYLEEGAGQYFAATSSGAKYGPRSDAAPKHQFQYSRFHQSKEFCHSCHDVSNPILENALVDPSGTAKFAASSYFHVERTSSEFLLSAYGMGGSATNIPGVATANKCQDCHMRDVTGTAANKAGIATRADLALHDLTGGNTWMSKILSSADPNHTGYDAYNYAILSGQKYTGAKIDVAGLASFGDELARGAQRAEQQVKMAATLSQVAEDGTALTLRVRNNTGHKLLSGFPEGRRMFLNVKFYDAGGQVLGEINRYDPLVKTTGATDTYVSGGDLDSSTRDEHLVWEAQMSSALTGESKTFHFALASDRHKDNRIPPKGFDTAKMDDRMAQPVWDDLDAPGYFTAAEYSGGYDEVTITKPNGAASYSATLYYQTTSKPYVEFLRDEINGVNRTLPGLGVAGDDPYLAQSDPFFSGLKGWGDAMWDLWVHNGGAEPVVMATLGGAPQPPTPLTADPPTSLKGSSARRSNAVSLSWTAPVSGANGYYVYRSSATGGPWTRIATTSTTSYKDAGLTAGSVHYYTVSTYKTDKLGTVVESIKSNEVAVTVR